MYLFWRALGLGALCVCASLAGLARADVPPADAPLATAHRQFGLELIVRPVNNFKTRDDIVQFFELAKRAEVAVVHLNVKQDEDDERPSGHVYYASAIAPVAAGYERFDVLEAAIAEAHQRGIKVYAWVPQFHDQAAVVAHPHWQMMASVHGQGLFYQGRDRVEYFINPIHPGVQAYQLSLLREIVRNYAVDGIDLDWMRFDDLNMDVGAYTRELARKEIGIDPMTLDFSVASQALERWNAWRSEKIGLYTRQVRRAVNAIRPGVRLTAFVLPPEFTEVGQDVARFSQDLDEVLPMAYYNDWEFPPAWVASGLMPDVAKKIVGNAVIKPTLDGTGSVADNVDILKAIRKNYPKVDSILWFSAVYWQPDALRRIMNIHRAEANSHGHGREASP